MGRPASSLPVDKLEPALAYLQRAAERGADFFTGGSKETRRALATLRRKALALRRPDFAAEANAWLGALSARGYDTSGAAGWSKPPPSGPAFKTP